LCIVGIIKGTLIMGSLGKMEFAKDSLQRWSKEFYQKASLLILLTQDFHVEDTSDKSFALVARIKASFRWVLWVKSFFSIWMSTWYSIVKGYWGWGRPFFVCLLCSLILDDEMFGSPPAVPTKKYEWNVSNLMKSWRYLLWWEEDDSSYQ